MTSKNTLMNGQLCLDTAGTLWGFLWNTRGHRGLGRRGYYHTCIPPWVRVTP